MKHGSELSWNWNWNDRNGLELGQKSFMRAFCSAPGQFRNIPANSRNGFDNYGKKGGCNLIIHNAVMLTLILGPLSWTLLWVQFFWKAILQEKEKRNIFLFLEGGCRFESCYWGKEGCNFFLRWLNSIMGIVWTIVKLGCGISCMGRSICEVLDHSNL